MTDCGLVWVKINGHIRQNLYFLKNATEDGLKIAWTLDTFTVSKARQVLGNVNNLIALRIMDSETQQYITDNLPKTRLKYIMRTQGVATSATHPGVFSGNVGERLMEEEGDLFAPQLLGQLPDLHYIAKLSGGRIVKGRLPVLRSSLDTGKA